MDGLRLALIVAGVVVVVAVYLWTARRRRMDREAGEFDRFDAWVDDRLDPLTDDPEPSARPVPADDIAGDPDTAPQTVGRDAAGPARETRSPRTPAGEAASLDDPKVLEGLEAIAESLQTRAEPTIGAVDRLDTGALGSKGGRAEASPADPGTRRAKPAGESAPPSPPASGGGTGASRGEGKGRTRKPAPGPRHAAAARDEAPAPAELVVVLNVMAPVGKTFEGPPLRDALENAGLRPGDMQLYHYRAEGQPADSAPIFSALNVIKPGTLPPEAFEGMRTPGVALVLSLPGPERPREAFELMHGTAMAMAQELGGRLCDETRSTLTGQTLNQLHERIADLSRRQRLRS